MKSTIIQHLKNIRGPKTKQRLVAICLDDYGNVRLHSRAAVEALDKKRIFGTSPFDLFDSLENSQDLECMLNTLSSVQDSLGHCAKLTALTNVANVDFERMQERGYSDYIYELLPETYQKLNGGYQDCMKLWLQGISSDLIRPEFHGREHLNLNILMSKLRNRDSDIMTCFSLKTLARLKEPPGARASWTAAFEFDEPTELAEHQAIISDGIACFEKVFGDKPRVFNAPGGREHPCLYSHLKEVGLRVVERTYFQWVHQGGGKYTPSFAYPKSESRKSPSVSIRNCVFEPTFGSGVDWVSHTLRQIEYAFYWNRPAIISCHRVNFVGGICEKNRAKGLTALSQLLQEIVKRWPDVKFEFLDDLCKRIGLYC
jgi:hypothetical protein